MVNSGRTVHEHLNEFLFFSPTSVTSLPKSREHTTFKRWKTWSPVIILPLSSLCNPIPVHHLSDIQLRPSRKWVYSGPFSWVFADVV